MTIKTKLRLAALFPIIFGCLIVFFEIRTVRIVDDVLTREKISGQILSVSSDLSRLGNGYVQEDANDRIRQQWGTAHNTLDSLLNESRSWNAAQKRVVVDELTRSHLKLGDLFEKLSSIVVSPDGAASLSAKRRQARWARQIFTKTESMRTLALQLGELCRNEIRQTQGRAFKFSILSTAGIIIGVTFILFLLGRSIVKALAVLRNDTEVVGTGDLDHRVNIEGKDEIGDLSRAFHTMITRLKSITASHDQLNEEVRVREQAEIELAAKETQLRTALEGMTGGLIMADKDHIIRVINDRIIEWYDIPSDIAKPGVPIRNLLYYRAERGDYGPGDADELTEQRLDDYKRGSISSSEDKMADGRVMELVRAPTHDGGTVIVCEDITKRKTAEEKMRNNLDELEKFNQLAVGRELRMVELKQQINDLLKSLGKKPEYEIVE